MKPVCIVVKDSKISEKGYSSLVESSKAVGNNFEIKKWDAIIPAGVDQFMESLNLKWNYPWKEETVDFSTGLKKFPYKTINYKARIACACSHYYWWNHSYDTNTTILILEHDAYFINKIDFDPVDVKADIIGINDPRNATRKANLFHSIIQQETNTSQAIPKIDAEDVPQGLAGNSAYIIKPAGARQLLEAVKQYGLWPNDAIMCYQLIQNMRVTKKYYTKVQGLKSTTT